MDVTDWSFSSFIKKIILVGYGWGFSEAITPSMSDNAMNRQLYGLIQRQGPGGPTFGCQPGSMDLNSQVVL